MAVETTGAASEAEWGGVTRTSQAGRKTTLSLIKRAHWQAGSTGIQNAKQQFQ
jgi:hypothetical protein